ncbi:MAG: prepilin peptidase [Clostridia bacterium]|nr:prepilin peptidase [Clostridia bacterium]
MILAFILTKAFDNHLLIIKGLVFFEILLFTAYHDAMTKEIPNIVHLLILLTALISFHPLSSIIGFFVVPLPYLLTALLKDGGIGGGDIKLMGACGFMLGVWGGVFAGIAGLTLAVTFNLVKCKKRQDSFPLAPYLSLGCVIAYLIFQ